jgi:hypothetical protein
VLLNDAIPRVDALPQTRHPNGLGRFLGSENDSPRINGTFSIPVVSMHTLGELFVPFHMEQVYARRAVANGNDDLVVVRAIRDTGHCGFTPTEQIQAFADMVTWVETGVRPDGDDVLGSLRSPTLISAVRSRRSIGRVWPRVRDRPPGGVSPPSDALWTIKPMMTTASADTDRLRRTLPCPTRTP